MIKHLLLLTFLAACLVMGAQAQFKFGNAAGYEHITSRFFIGRYKKKK